jgi:hypothetical protein
MFDVVVSCCNRLISSTTRELELLSQRILVKQETIPGIHMTHVRTVLPEPSLPVQYRTLDAQFLVSHF